MAIELEELEDELEQLRSQAGEESLSQRS